MGLPKKEIVPKTGLSQVTKYVLSQKGVEYLEQTVPSKIALQIKMELVNDRAREVKVRQILESRGDEG